MHDSPWDIQRAIGPILNSTLTFRLVSLDDYAWVDMHWV